MHAASSGMNVCVLYVCGVPRHPRVLTRRQHLDDEDVNVCLPDD